MNKIKFENYSSITKTQFLYKTSFNYLKVFSFSTAIQWALFIFYVYLFEG